MKKPNYLSILRKCKQIKFYNGPKRLLIKTGERSDLKFFPRRIQCFNQTNFNREALLDNERFQIHRKNSPGLHKDEATFTPIEVPENVFDDSDERISLYYDPSTGKLYKKEPDSDTDEIFFSDWLYKTTPSSSGRLHHTTRPDSNIIKNFFAQPDTSEAPSPKPQPVQIPPDLPETAEEYEEFLPSIELDNSTTKDPGDRYETFTEYYEEERVENRLGSLAGPYVSKMGGLLNKDGHFRHSYSTRAFAGEAREDGVGQPAVEYFKSSKKLRRTLEEDEDEPFLKGENADENLLFYYEEDIEETNIYPARNLEDVKVKKEGDVGGEKSIESVGTPESLTNITV